MTDKHISQLVGADGKPSAAATSAPGCFIHDDESLARFPELRWAAPFSVPHKGNSVEFYVTGEEYFNAVATAIEGARESIYITGWQVNFDVELKGGKTLYQCLEAAIDGHPQLRIYVMPWLSPKVGVDTCDFETMLAVFQLNAGLPPPARAFALPAIAQSDMPAGLGIGFSHHQKLVVIDQQRAFVGGIDLAYGRRDNGKFLLRHDNRAGNELYNSCVPPVHELTHMELTRYLTRAELLAACFDGKFGSAAQFITSAPLDIIAKPEDAYKKVSDFKKDTYKRVDDWWTNLDLVPEFVHKAQDIPVDMAQGVSRWAYKKLNKNAKGMLDRLRSSGSANAADFAAALLAWLNNASMEQLPHNLRQGTVELIETFVISTLGYLSGAVDQHAKRYENLAKLRKMAPASGKVISAAQPRMPWHDVHSSIRGAAVSDLCRNFVQRWNGIAHRYETSQGHVASYPALAKVFKSLGLPNRVQVNIPKLSPPPLPEKQGKPGSCWVQVLRSAPLTMQRDEEKAMAGVQPFKPATMAQNNCLKAMLTAIRGAQKFIYIEGQFFQSAYGADPTLGQHVSGPLSALIDIASSAQYQKYAKQLEIFGLPVSKIPEAIRWSQVDDVMADVKGKGADFMHDLYGVLKNVAAIEASKLMGRQQHTILNRIGEALAQRIEAAIADDLPFHVYMVIPVHPEGTLNTLNIMTQLHLTMQSVVLADNSLVNRVRRAVLSSQLRKDKKLSKGAADQLAGTYRTAQLAETVGDGWKRYLTLLNLRNWDTLQNRPVTEQIYVHSKLLIADDRVAILGSANINDRSQLGDRDSELAVVVRDDAHVKASLDGVGADTVSKEVHKLRVRLWNKLFGLSDGAAAPAGALASVIAHPAASATIKAIQRVADGNAQAYAKAFPFLAHMGGAASSIWPTWNNAAKKLDYHMPFAERFWRADEVRDEMFTWDAKQRARESAPVGVQGFIVALPLTWTAGENNISGMNLTMLAQVEEKDKDGGEVELAANTAQDVPSGSQA